ncbi:MAG: ribonuclease HII [Rickettsiaceae bacterium]|nr:ribonuclease HII [Rickettsiaceae bacterium]
MIIIGIDEVGRGSLVGPVVACACLLDDLSPKIPDVRDSKLISKSKIYKLAKTLAGQYKYGIGIASVQEIDEINILEATKLAIKRAEENLKPHNAEKILIDGNINHEDSRFESIPKGDNLIYAISCASIIAKEYRDRLMRELALEYSIYGWEKNAGYGSKAHIEAIKLHGISPHHRKKFISKIV